MPNLWTDATGLLATICPVLASAIGGPLAGIATTSIIGALGLAPDTPPPRIAAALSAATPEQLLALKQAENAFRVTLRQLDVDMAKVTAGDRADARGREIAVHDRTPAVLAYALTVGFFALVWLMVFHSVPEPNAAAVNILLGTLGTSWIAAMSYYFGSTQGSKAKTEMLFQSTPPSSVAHQPSPIAQAIQVEAPQTSDDRPSSEGRADRTTRVPSPDFVRTPRLPDDVAAAVEQARTVGEDQADAAR